MIGGLFSYGMRMPEWFADRVRTFVYRRQVALHPTARVLGQGRILNPSRRSDAVTIGPHSVVRGELFVFPHAGGISIGEWCFLGENSRIWSSAQVTIGNRVLVSHDVNIHDTNAHPLRASERHAHFREIGMRGHPEIMTNMIGAPVTIGDDAWIGFGSTVLKGVSIAQGAIVAARSLVTSDVPPWTLVAGHPARIVRELAPHER